MQITLVETELKQAITEFVGRQMKIADGMAMNIELSATRGAEGFKATIDIQPSAAIVGKELPPFREAVKVAESPIRQQPFVPAVVQQASTARSPEPTAEAQAEAVEETAAVEEQPGAVEILLPTNEVQAETSGANPRSLFGGLKKPKN